MTCPDAGFTGRVKKKNGRENGGKMVGAVAVKCRERMAAYEYYRFEKCGERDRF